MSEEEQRIQEIQVVFDKYDILQEGSIKTFEIVNALRSLEGTATQDDVDEILSTLGIIGETITMEEFLSIVQSNEEREAKAELIQAFNKFDKAKQGFITYQQLEKIVKPILGTDLTEEELKDIVAQADSDGNGKIEIDEFVDFLSG